VNVLALVIVLGLCWGAMLWLSGKFHGHGATPTQIDGLADLSARVDSSDPCEVCDGVGAHTTSGKITPCSTCYGTGVAA